MAEKRAIGPWRKRLWSEVDGGHILEVGAGTGKNFSFYPPEAKVTAIDLSPGMLRFARAGDGESQAAELQLLEMDVQHLDLQDAAFDSVLVTFVFCCMHGANIDRETADNIRAAGFFIEKQEDLWSDIVKLFVARRAT
ncbi:MAG: class I SAM-dependent methyltransferase [Actinobacteria bacterium]|nr:class I SAM-dependent methyltransferase [Actinomycetota bacterium]